MGGTRSQRVAWPDLRKRSAEDALAALKGEYTRILAAVTREWVILEQIDPALIGAHNPYELTARAVREALSELGTQETLTRKPSVAFCVFDRPSVVAAYDAAFAAVSDRGGDGDASGRVATYADDIDSFLRSRVPKQKGF